MPLLLLASWPAVRFPFPLHAPNRTWKGAWGRTFWRGGPLCGTDWPLFGRSMGLISISMGWKCDSMGWIGRSMGCFQPIDGMFLAEIADEMALICHAGCAKRPLTVFSLRPRGGPLGGCGGSVRSISRVDACRNFLENCPRRSLRRAGQTVGDDGGRQGRFAARVSSFSKKTGGGGGVSAEILNFVSVNENHARACVCATVPKSF